MALPKAQSVHPHVRQELADYAEWIKQYRAGKIGEIKMQKIRLQLGTYAQRQEGVQMERIKIPGGTLTSDQLIKLADVAEKFAGGFIHFSTREDAQLYYIKLEQCPEMMLDLASAGITTREACGNTVRNITACHYSGMSATEPFDVTPYALALYRYLLRNKFNQVMGRKVKIAFEGCIEDHAGMLYHDLGFQAQVRQEGNKTRRGFRVWVAGGLGGTPLLGQLYTDFLPEEELMNLAAATLRIFDRYGERKNRMIARQKFLTRKLGWEKHKALIDEERAKVRVPQSANDYLAEARRDIAAPALPTGLPASPAGAEDSATYKQWVRDSVVSHKHSNYAGALVRLKLGDILSEPSRALAEIARIYSRGKLTIDIGQNLFLPWVPRMALPALHAALAKIGLAEAGANTIEDITTCPGADTCRLGITSAKGLGAEISSSLNNGNSHLKELGRDLKIKVSGCPNGCAQHAVANIGFHGAAMSKDGKTVPAHNLFVGGSQAFGETSIGTLIGKVPARNGTKVVATLLELYKKEGQGKESFNACMKRVGVSKIKEALATLTEIPSFDKDPEFYKDLGHENEKFAIRTGIKGECAGATIQEKVPVMETAKEHLAQAEAFLAHKEYANAQLEAYEAMAHAARVPLYKNLVDPFTSEQALWGFENIFVRSGKASGDWLDISEKMEAEKNAPASEQRAQELIALAKKFLSVCQEI